MSQYLDNFSPFQAPLKSHHWQKFDTTGLNCTIRFKLLNKPLNRYQLPGGPGNIIRPYWKWRQIRCPGAKLSQGCRKVSLPAAHTSPELSPPSVVLRPSNWCSSPRGGKKNPTLTATAIFVGLKTWAVQLFNTIAGLNYHLHVTLVAEADGNIRYSRKTPSRASPNREARLPGKRKRSENQFSLLPGQVQEREKEGWRREK